MNGPLIINFHNSRLILKMKFLNLAFNKSNLSPLNNKVVFRKFLLLKEMGVRPWCHFLYKGLQQQDEGELMRINNMLLKFKSLRKLDFEIILKQTNK